MNERIPVSKVEEPMVIEDAGGKERIIPPTAVEFDPAQEDERALDNFTEEFSDLLVGKSAEDVKKYYEVYNREPRVKRSLTALQKAKLESRNQFDQKLWDQLITIAVNSEVEVDIDQFFTGIRQQEALGMEAERNMSESELRLKRLGEEFRRESDEIKTRDALERSDAIAKTRADDDEVEIEIPEDDKAA